MKVVIGYGSAFFPQKDYDYSKDVPQLDLILVVENV